MCKTRSDYLTVEALILSNSYRDKIFNPKEIARATEDLAAARQPYAPYKQIAPQKHRRASSQRLPLL